MKEFLAVVLEVTMNVMAKITFPYKRTARHGVAFPICAAIGLAAVTFLNCVAQGQVVVSGSAVLSGNVQLSSSSGGAPLTYSARTDGCVNPTATPASCIAGTATGQAGATLLFQEGLSDPIPTGFAATTISSGSCPSGLTPSAYPAYCPAPMNSTATDPDFGSYLVMASDDWTQLGGLTSWTAGSDGGHDSFTPDESLVLLVGSNGNTTLINVNPASIHAKTCASSPCVSPTGIFEAGSGGGSTTSFAHNAIVTASRNPSEPKTLYEQVGNQVNRLVVASSIGSPGTGTLARTTYVDFTSDTPVACSVIPPITVGANTSNYQANWYSSVQMANDGSVGYGTAGGYDWLPSWTPADVVGNTIFIYPLSNNGSHHGFQATAITGPTGATEPNWASSCYTTGCTEGGVTWADIGGLNSQGPGFDVFGYRPGFGCFKVNTRLAKIYGGTGHSSLTGPLKTLDPVACTRVLGVPCSGTPVTLPDTFTLHAVGQMMNGGILSMDPTGSEALNAPGNWNSGTLTCQPSGASDVWAGAWNSGTTYTNKQTVSYTDGTSAYYVATSAGSNLSQPPRTGGVVNSTFWTQQEAYCAHYYLQASTNLVAPTTDWADAAGHTAAGYLYRYYAAKYASARYDTPSAQLSPPNGAITLNPGTKLLTTALPTDNHGSYRNAGAGDLQPVLGFTFDAPAWVTNYTAACYTEICGFANVATGAKAATYRFAHNYASGNNQLFSVQSAIGVVSPLGDLAIWGTDMVGTRGSTATAATACNNVRGQFAPVAGMTLNVNDTLYPASGNAGNHIYKATVGGLTSGSAPTGGWCQTTGCIATWGAATVQEIGVNDCRGDMVIVDLTSAHPAAATPSLANLLDPTRATDWTTAGFEIPNYMATCSGSPPTLLAGSGNAAANSTAIQNALASCDSTHNVVNLPSGTYYVAGIKYPAGGSNRVLRGVGSSTTYLNMTAGASGCGYLSSICMQATPFAQGSNVNAPSGTQQCMWTGTNGVAGTYTQGATSIILNSCGGTPLTGVFVLDQQNDLSDTGGQYVCDSYTGFTCTYKSPGNADGRLFGSPLLSYSEQVVTYGTVQSGSGTGPYTVTITPPVYFNNYRSGQSPGAYWGGTVSNLGIENLTVDESTMPAGNNNGILLMQCYHCWITGVRSIKGQRNHIDLFQTSGAVIRNNYFFQSQTSGSQSYGIEIAESSAGLIENNIFQQVVGPTVPDAMSGFVIAYNMSIAGTGTNQLQDVYDSHNAGGGFNLFEGNQILGFFNDTSTWGSAGLSTLFRNRIVGWEPGYTVQTNAFNIYSFARGYNLVGNVLGQPGYHTVYEAYPPNSYTSTQCNQALFYLGFSGGGCASVNSVPNDTLVRSTLMRWGNYDTVNAAVQWNATEASPASATYINANFSSSYFSGLSHTLPASLYLSAKPSWWGTMPYPAIGPDVSSGTGPGGFSYNIPAANCYYSVMSGPADGSGGALSFDVATCYP